MRRLGDSVDWTRERFTMDEGLSAAVQTIFKSLFDDGLMIEVEHREDEGELVSIRYGEGDDVIVVATTRAETMLGDTAVAVHPDDPRYAHLVGRSVELPLTGRPIPVVADPHVDPEFGTGAVKVTPAHDPNDFEIGRRRNLPSHGNGPTSMAHRGAWALTAMAHRGARAHFDGPSWCLAVDLDGTLWWLARVRAWIRLHGAAHRHW